MRKVLQVVECDIGRSAKRADVLLNKHKLMKYNATNECSVAIGVDIGRRA